MRLGALLLCVAFLMAVGITQPGGAGTTIFFYDNASAPDATAYHFADIAAAFPADFIDLGTSPKAYRSKVSLQCGDATTGAASTTLQDTDCTVIFDITKTLLYRFTQSASWTTSLGTKVGTGNKASGRSGVALWIGATTTIRGNLGIYGSSIRSAGGALAFTPAVSGQNYELVNCIVANVGTAATSTISLGSSSVAMSNLYNVDFLSNISGVSTGIINTLNCDSAERLTIAGPSMGSFIRSGQAALSVKDLVLLGTPSSADMSCTSAGSVTWTLVDITWSGNAPKFTNTTQAAGNITEYRTSNIHLDDNGTPVAGLSAKLTDILGNLLVNGNSDVVGGVSFGSGLTANALPVRDHYGVNSYLTRERTPYLGEYNTVNVNANYPQIRYNHGWPKDMNGNFENLGDVVALRPASGGPTPWMEMEI